MTKKASMKALKLIGNSRKQKKAIIRFHKVRKFFLLIKTNPRARDFVLRKMKEKGIDFNINEALSEDFFEGLTDMFKLECIGCVVFNHKFFQFVEETNSIPYRDNFGYTQPPINTTP